MLIYKATNKINGKFYIGKTEQLFSNRKKQHINAALRNEGQIFGKAIRKYGPDNFDWEILCLASSKASLSILERIFIAELNPEYNLMPGGEGISKGHKVSEETRKRMSLAQKGRIISVAAKEKLRAINTGKKLSDETKKKITKTLKETWSTKEDKVIRKGWKHSEETIEKMRISARNTWANRSQSISSDIAKKGWKTKIEKKDKPRYPNIT